jgi:hypothetical protein
LKQVLEQLLSEALSRLAGTLLPAPVDPKLIVIERTRDAANGDYATNVAMRLAKLAKLPPRDLAAEIVKVLPASPQVLKVEIAGAGFINLFLRPEAKRAVVQRIFASWRRLWPRDRGAGKRVQVEFVSPTRPARCTSATAVVPRTARASPICSRPPASGAARVLRQRCRPPDGHPRRVGVGCVTSSCGEAVPVPGQRLQGRLRPEIAAELRAVDGDRCATPAGEP